MKKTAHSSRAKINQISKSLNISVVGVYLVILLVVSLIGILVANGALNQSQDTRSAASSYQTVGCNQPCLNNRYCQADHFCYQGQCRLAANPESSTCDPTETIVTLAPTKTPSPTDNPLAGRKGELVNIPIASNGAEATTATKSVPTRMPTIDESDYQPMPIPAIKPSFISQIADKFDAADNQLLLIVGAGVGGLIVLIILVTIINGKKKKISYQPVSFSNLETPNNKANPQTPTPVIKSKQTPVTTVQDQDLTPPPSSMISRIKEKKIQKPKK